MKTRYTKIILIRHGQTQSNSDKRYSGWSNIPLNKKGRAQARRIKNHLSKEPIDKLYSSDLRRACEFAGIAFGNRKIVKIRELREINLGVFEGLSHEEIKTKYPGQYDAWLSNPRGRRIPQGESFRDVKRRIMKFFKKMTGSMENKTVAIVSHAGPIKAIIDEIKKSDNLWKIEVDNSSITVIEAKNGKLRIKKINDTSFLKPWEK